MSVKGGNCLPKRKNKCEICNTEFNYKSVNVTKTCSDACHKERRKSYHKKNYLSRKIDIDTVIKESLRRIKTRSRKLNMDNDIDFVF